MHCPTNEDKQLFARSVAARLNQHHSLSGNNTISSRCIRKARQGNNTAIERILMACGTQNVGKSLTMRDMENKPFKQEERSPKKGYKVGIKRPNKGNVALIS